MPDAPAPDVSLEPLEGWHCSHLFYRFDRARLTAINPATIAGGREQLIAILNPTAPDAPARLQTSVVSGHKADFALMMLDPNPLKLSAIHQRLMACCLGPAIVPTYSFISLTEVSEYVPTVEQYGRRLIEEGEQPDSAGYKAKLRAYESREGMMRRQRLMPDLPSWPATCFYPMNKKREPGENWFTLPAAERHRLMTEHGKTGMTFGGKVTQLITASTGLDDWEWGVTLWARNPQFLKEIVYTMRFDEASARYAQFGPFYVSYVVSAAEMLDHCRIGVKK